MTEPDITTEARRLAEAATPGPWEWNSYNGIWATVSHEHPGCCTFPDEPGQAHIATVTDFAEHGGDVLEIPEAAANAAFIAWAREGVPALLERIEEGERYAEEGWAWVEEACRAMGVPTVFDFRQGSEKRPSYDDLRTRLAAAESRIVGLEDARAALVADRNLARVRIKELAKETNELFDCDWGCGCGFYPDWEHAHEPCGKCARCRLTADNQRLRGALEDALSLLMSSSGREVAERMSEVQDHIRQALERSEG